jgi:hypothetical protein
VLAVERLILGPVGPFLLDIVAGRVVGDLKASGRDGVEALIPRTREVGGKLRVSPLPVADRSCGRKPFVAADDGQGLPLGQALADS